ncbi:hypothetical protein MERGE_000458 [Pneumocystis wakefieldiae]|uniref:Protein farnesyltransferase/geranylgeranyltransferase type-1 subunit alpha n=1 Tax=Pneumocystis wakefieldiae TaxID=38082 RepID=A0A899G0E4_9ASCO|nr:hypothetical protein MERGE_000458 [Pneumocystis wakefieldiae]
MDASDSWKSELHEILDFDNEGALEPVFQDEGVDPIAPIAYPPYYSEAMAYIKAIMIKEEMSERAMRLTAYIINMNPAHYTICYQLWHYRQFLMDMYGDPSMELNFLAEVLEKDSKNYHAWSYRQWLTERFNLWDIELPYIDRFLKQDIRNNSAWNYRFYIVFRDHYVSDDTMKKEIEYCKDAIAFSPQNSSPWLYLRGIFEKYNQNLSFLEPFCLQYASLNPNENQQMSSEALEFLADIYSLNDTSIKNAKKALQLLIDKYDTIRKKYWEYKILLLDRKDNNI